MPQSAFSRAPSRIFYPILFYKFCLLAEFFSGLCYGWRRLECIAFCWRKRGIRQKVVEGYNTSELGYVIVFAFVATEIRSFIYG